MNSTEKRLSVIMPNFNHGHYLNKRLETILEQLAQNDEIIIVDDGSTDNSVEIIENFSLKDPRVRLLRNLQNIGVIKTTNHAISMAQGQYLAMMSSDDFVLPNFFEKTMAVLSDHPEIGICSSNCAISFVGYPDKNPDEITNFQLIDGVNSVQVFPFSSIMKIFRTTNFWIPAHTAIFKRDLFFKYGPLDEQLGPRCDWLLLHQIALNEGAGYIPEALSVIRQIPSSYSKSFKEKDINRSLLKRLTQRDQKTWRKQWVDSCLLSGAIMDNFFWTLFRPQYWDFLFHVTMKFFRKRLRRKTKKITV